MGRSVLIQKESKEYLFSLVLALPLWVWVDTITEFKIFRWWEGIQVYESRKNTFPYPFASNM